VRIRTEAAAGQRDPGQPIDETVEAMRAMADVVSDRVVDVTVVPSDQQ
jgi:hypothetical protein